MYEAFFGLTQKPFTALPDPEFLFESAQHATALSLLEYSVTGKAGFCVVTGGIGCGKTTLIHAFLHRLPDDITVGIIPNTHRSFRDISRWVLMSFDQKPVGQGSSEIYQELMLYLITEYGAGRRCMLIVDEAQNLTVEALEELRVLSNINSGNDLLLQIVLVGQPELLETLNHPALAQFAQRISVSHHLTKLPFAEVQLYVRRRLERAGAKRALFSDRAIAAVHYFSDGVPRLINSICDLALVYAFADERAVVDFETVRRVVTDRSASGIALYAHLERLDDPALEAEIAALLGDRAGPSPAGAEAAPAAAQDNQFEPVEPGAAGTAESAARAEPAVILVGVPYRQTLIDVDAASAASQGWRDVSQESMPPAGSTSAPDIDAPNYLRPELQVQWPAIPGRAGLKGATRNKPGSPAAPATRATLRRHFLPRT